MDRYVYLTGVSMTLFPAVVKATMDGKPTLAQTDLGQVGTAPSRAEHVVRSTPEHIQ